MSTETETTAAPPAEATKLSPYGSYAIGVLFLVNTLNYLDRTVINIVAQDIKNELHLLDWQIGAMSGFAFALLYIALGLPIARLADRGNRPMIIAVSLAVWSGFTAACGLAQNFVQLVLARMGVGIGEAGCLPPIHSLVSEYAPPKSRATALSIISMGSAIGGVGGTTIGGLVADSYGWRAAFYVCGAPGLLLALVVALTLLEPRLRDAAAKLKAQTEAAQRGKPIREAVEVLRLKRTFWLFAIGGATKIFIGAGQGPFVASFFFRAHAEELAQTAAKFGLQSAGLLGLTLGLTSGIGGALGSFIGGILADKLSTATDRRSFATVPAVAAFGTIPISLYLFNAPSLAAAAPALFLQMLVASLWLGPVYATAQSIVTPRMRATSAAVLLFVMELVGTGFGPLAIGLLSDSFAIGGGMGKIEGLRWALISSTFVLLLTGALFWRARGTINRDLES